MTGLPLLPLLLARLLGDGIEPGRLLPSPGLGSSPQLAGSGQDGVAHIGQVQLFLLERERMLRSLRSKTTLSARSFYPSRRYQAEVTKK